MNRSKRTFAFVPVVAALAVLFAGTIAAGTLKLALAPGDPAPPMKGNKADKTFVQPIYTNQKVTVINFWATWCEVCKNQMPALDSVYAKHHGAGLDIVGVMLDGVTLPAMQEFANSLGVTYTVIRPFEGYDKKWGGIGVLPTTFLIDSEGRVLRRYIGASEEQIEGQLVDIEAALAGEPLGPLVLPDTPPTE